MSAHPTPRCPGSRRSIHPVKTKRTEAVMFTAARAGSWLHSGPWTTAQKPAAAITTTAISTESRPRHSSPDLCRSSPGPSRQARSRPSGASLPGILSPRSGKKVARIPIRSSGRRAIGKHQRQDNEMWLAVKLFAGARCSRAEFPFLRAGPGRIVVLATNNSRDGHILRCFYGDRNRAHCHAGKPSSAPRLSR